MKFYIGEMGITNGGLKPPGKWWKLVCREGGETIKVEGEVCIVGEVRG